MFVSKETLIEICKVKVLLIGAITLASVKEILGIAAILISIYYTTSRIIYDHRRNNHNHKNPRCRCH